jgi:hypothetical protein
MIPNSVRAILIGSLLVSLHGAPVRGQSVVDQPSDSSNQILQKQTDSARKGSDRRHCVVQISTLRVEDMKLDDTLDLLIETGGVEIGGWQFKLAVASDVIDIVDILPGELIDSCRWEMFDARQVQPPAFPNGPREVWQITAMAQGVSGKKKPVCYGFDRPTSVAHLVVSSAHRTSVPDTTVEVFFYWEYCRDNSLSDRGGASLISARVTDTLPVDFVTQQDSLPTRQGLPASCLSRSSRNAPLRQVEFRNGGIEFKFKADSSATDSMSPNE